MTNHLNLVSHSNKPSDSISGNITKHQKYKSKSDAKDLVNPLRNAGKITEYDEFMSGYFDKKIERQARMTSSIKSTIKSLEVKKNIQNKIILESDEI